MEETKLKILFSVIFSLFIINNLSGSEISIGYSGFDDNRHVFIIDHNNADAIGISLNKRQEIKVEKDAEGKAFRIRISNLNEGLHRLSVNFYDDNNIIDHRNISIFNYKNNIKLSRNYLWISRFDIANTVNRNNFNTQKKYNEAIIASLDRMLINASNNGITDILFQIRGQGDTLYRSNIEPFSHILSLNNIIGEDPGWCPLDYMIKKCNEYNLNIHLWINVYPIHWQREHKLKTVNGLMLPFYSNKHLLAYDIKGNLPSRHGYIYMHPALTGTSDYIISILDEILKNYDFDGIHFDYLRLDDQRYIYNTQLLKEYESVKDNLLYKDFLQNKIDANMLRYNNFIKSHSDRIIISSAVIGRLRGDGFAAYNTFQKPIEWLEEGLLDLIFPMTYFYPQSLKHLEELLNDLNPSFHNRVIPGIGAYLTLKREQGRPFSYISESYRSFNKLNIGGIAIFSAEALEANKYWGKLRQLLFSII